MISVYQYNLAGPNSKSLFLPHSFPYDKNASYFSLLYSYTYLHPSLIACGLLGLRKHSESLQKRNYLSCRKTISEHFYCLRKHFNIDTVLSSWFADVALIGSTYSPSAHQKADGDKESTHMSNNSGKLGSPINTMVKPGYISPVHSADLTTDTNSKTTSKLCKSLTTNASTSSPFVFHKTNDNIYKQVRKSVAMISKRFCFLFDS